jgi:RNA polymerase sigma-70 factor, ECF subfamily
VSEPLNDQEIRNAFQGDRNAFGAVVRSTSRLVYAFLYLETGDPHRSDDLVQETFLLAWRNRIQLSEPKNVRAWLLQIARRAMLDDVKHESRKKRSGPMSDIPLTLLPGRMDEPGELVGREETRAIVINALRNLPEQYRLPLSLRYLAGCDYAQISDQLGLSNGSLHGLLHRGLGLLRETMRDTR